jgi:hypothetical protein
MAHGGRPRAGPAACADGAARLRLGTHPRAALHHRPLCGRRAGDPRPPERRAARGDRLGRHRWRRRVGQQCRVLRRTRPEPDALRAAERPVPRVLGRGAAGQLRDERFRGPHGAGACRPRHPRPDRAHRRDGRAHRHRLPVRRPFVGPRRRAAVRGRRQRQHPRPGRGRRRVLGAACRAWCSARACGWCRASRRAASRCARAARASARSPRPTATWCCSSTASPRSTCCWPTCRSRSSGRRKPSRPCAPPWWAWSMPAATASAAPATSAPTCWCATSSASTPRAAASRSPTWPRPACA